MPARDIFHYAVKNALQKEGWTITHDPLFIRFDESKLYIDLAAEKLIADEKYEQSSHRGIAQINQGFPHSL